MKQVWLKFIDYSCNPSTEEAKAGSRPAWATQPNPVSKKKRMLRIIPFTSIRREN
jgi:hypothetical protein